MSVHLGVIDYGMGNRRSVHKALEHVGTRVTASSEADRLAGCDGLVLPGVGAFPAAMRELSARGLDRLIVDRVSDGVPLLGICLGMQLLFEGSEEIAPTAGLGLLRGHVGWLQAGELRLPHIGWSKVRFERPTALTAGLPAEGCPFYHVHSLVARPQQADQIVATAQYGERFATIVADHNVFGVQFHPEKSSRHGLAMLRAFTQHCARTAVGAATARE